MSRLKDIWNAFTANAHTVALENLADANHDGNVTLADVNTEYLRVQAYLKARQATYWNALFVVALAFIAGLWIGHRFL